MLAALQWTLGVVLYLAAAAVLFALGERLGNPAYGAGLAALVLLLLPALVTSWFVRAYHRLDSRSTFAQNFPGICAIVSALTLLLLPLVARGAVADALELSTARRPEFARVAARPVRAIATWLRASSASETSASPSRGVRNDAGALAPRAVITLVDGGREYVVSADARVIARAIAPDAGHGSTDTPRAEPDEENAGEDAPDRVLALASAHEIIVPVCAGNTPRGIATVPTHHGAADRIWVGCLGDYGELYGVRADGVVERVATVRMPPPANAAPDAHVAYVHEAAGADLDGDGASDLVLCAGYYTERGGSRGGALAWARARADGGYAPLEKITTVTCAGFAVADLDAHPGVEIALVDYGNAFAPDPRGRLNVLTGRGGTWHTRSSLVIAREPEHFALRDVNGDGRPDAVIAHDGVPDSPRVYPGNGLAFLEYDPALHAHAPDVAHFADGDLDGDGTRDDRADFVGNALRLRRAHEMTLGSLGASAGIEIAFPAQ